VHLPPASARRALAPLLVIVLTLALALFGVLAALCILAWPLTRRRRVFRLCCFGCVYLVVELSVVAACTWQWLRRLVGRRSRPEWITVHTRLLAWALTVLLRAADTLLHFRVDLTEPPDTAPLLGHEPVLVLARHGGPGDSLALVHLLLTRYRRSVRIVLKEMLAVDPALDILLTRLNCVFLPATSRGPSAAALIGRAVVDLRGTDTMLLFPEGNNWTPARRARIIDHMRRRRAQRTNLAEQLEYLLPPRPSGALACLKAHPDLEVVLFAHTGLEELMTVKDVWEHLPFDTPMSVRWWKTTSKPAAPDFAAVDDWLVTEWAIIDEWIGTQADQGRRLSSPSREGR
jgi:1-acyl-sn-glycerol-3-phosphate acyltransferase